MATKKRNAVTQAGAQSRMDREIKNKFTKGRKAAKGVVKGETTPEQKEVINLSRAMVTRYISQYVGFSLRELKARLNHPDTPMLERIIIQIIMRSEKNADQWRLEFLLNRSVGKVKDELELTTPDPYANLTDEELLARRKSLAEKNLETIRMMQQALVPKQQQISQPEEATNVSVQTEAEGQGST